MSEKTFVAGWMLWIFLIFMVMGGVLAIFRPAGMWWERQVMIESHQYKEARATEQAIFKSQLIAVRSRMNDPTLTPQLRAALKRQELMLMQQMNISQTRAGQKGIITKTIENNF